MIPALLVGTLASHGQLPTGDIAGRVINEGQPLPGASVTAKSPNLQDGKTTITSYLRLLTDLYVVRNVR